MCMFGYCWSWADLVAKIEWVRSQYALGTGYLLAFDSVIALLAAIVWVGLDKVDAGWVDKIPHFFASFSQIFATISAVVSAAWGAYKVLQAAVKTEQYDGSNGYYGASFMSYGGNSFIGNFLGTFEALWVIAYMVQLSEIALAPFVLSYLINKTWVEAPADLQKSFDLIYLYWGFIIAFGSFVSAWALGESADRLIGFFDIQNTNAV